MSYTASASLRARPGLAEVMTSKKVRLLVGALIFGIIFLALLQGRESLPISVHSPIAVSSPISVPSPTPTPSPISTPPPDNQEQTTPSEAPHVDWSRFAYVQYVTNSDYLCNSVMIFESLHQLGSKADRVMMYPSHITDPDAVEPVSDDARLLLKARDEYNVHLAPISVQHRDGGDGTWADSFTKLLAFNQTLYSRVLSLDSDGIVMQPMDELFLLPPCPVAMPRAYWLYPEKQILSSQVMLVQPSEAEFERVMEKINGAGFDDYDMEIVNYLYKDNALILPHRPYDMLTSEFREKDHQGYLGTDREEWDPVAIYNEAKFVHFSDWPVPKPWLEASDDVREEMQPECHDNDGIELCTERDIWNGLYDDFKKRREV